MTTTATDNAVWTDERVELLTKLWAAGLSASMIMQQMPEFTRSAIFGKARRLDLPMRVTKVRSTAGVQRPTRRIEKHATPRHATRRLRQLAETMVKAAPVFPVEPLPADDPAPNGGIALIDLSHDACRWPLGPKMEKAELFCGAKCQEGSSWCPTHRARVFVQRHKVTKPFVIESQRAA